MRWIIQYSEAAKRDLNAIYEYIDFVLLAPQTAADMVHQLTQTIRSLDTMPLRFPVYDHEPWNTQNLRVTSVKDYLVFYLPNEKNRTVTVVRILYGGRDLEKQLEENER